MSEFQNTTEITPTTTNVKILTNPTSMQPASIILPQTNTSRESFKNMLLTPQNPYTITNNYTLNQYNKLKLATNTTPLYTPTKITNPHDATTIKTIQNNNTTHTIILNNKTTTNFLTTTKNTPLP